MFSDDRQNAICCVSLRCNCEGLGVSNPGAGEDGPLYTDNAKPPNDPSILRTECELRQQGARRRDPGLGADWLSGEAASSYVMERWRSEVRTGRDQTETFFAKWTRIHRRQSSSRAHAAAPSRSPVFSRDAALPRDPTAPPAPSNLAYSLTTALRRPLLELFPVWNPLSSNIRRFSSNTAGSKFEASGSLH
eukprot:2720840-Pleurochrysis_carterae.AAC.1